MGSFPACSVNIGYSLGTHAHSKREAVSEIHIKNVFDCGWKVGGCRWWLLRWSKCIYVSLTSKWRNVHTFQQSHASTQHEIIPNTRLSYETRVHLARISYTAFAYRPHSRRTARFNRMFYAWLARNRIYIYLHFAPWLIIQNAFNIWIPKCKDIFKQSFLGPSNNIIMEPLGLLCARFPRKYISILSSHRQNHLYRWRKSPLLCLCTLCVLLPNVYPIHANTQRRKNKSHFIEKHIYIKYSKQLWSAWITCVSEISEKWIIIFHKPQILCAYIYLLIEPLESIYLDIVYLNGILCENSKISTFKRH